MCTSIAQEEQEELAVMELASYSTSQDRKCSYVLWKGELWVIADVLFVEHVVLFYMTAETVLFLTQSL